MQPRLGQTLGRTDRKRFLPPSATQLGFAWVLTQFLGVFSQFSPLPAAVGTSCDPAGLSEQQPPLGFARLTPDPLPPADPEHHRHQPGVRAQPGRAHPAFLLRGFRWDPGNGLPLAGSGRDGHGSGGDAGAEPARRARLQLLLLTVKNLPGRSAHPGAPCPSPGEFLRDLSLSSPCLSHGFPNPCCRDCAFLQPAHLQVRGRAHPRGHRPSALPGGHHVGAGDTGALLAGGT